MLPNYSDAYFLSDDAERKSVEPAFNVFLGEAWENLVRSELGRRPIDGVGGRWRKASRWWGSGLDRRQMEVDVVAESIDGRTLLVGEAKLSLTEKEASRELTDLEVKARMLPFAGDYGRIVTKLFVAKGGVKDAVSLEWLDE